MTAARVVRRRVARIAAALLAAAVSGCGHGGPGRDATAAGIAQATRLDGGTSKGAAFDLQIYRRDDGKPGPLVVYIEGDGLAYLDARTPSADPTPLDPLALRLAAADPGPAVLFLGRPCQFAPGRADPRCTLRDWTTGRFAAPLVAALDEAVSRERAKAPARELVLVGYSGGGVMAALVAARRSDVALLITVAAPLDVADWTRRLGLSPLTGSAFPLNHAERLSQVRLVAFAGQKDETVPVASIASAVATLGPSAKLVVVPDFDHRCCWARDWPRLRKVAFNE